MRDSGGNCLKYLKSGSNRRGKRGQKHFKKGRGQADLRGGCLKNRGLKPPYELCIPRCYKDVYVNSFFPRTAMLWNSLPIECFPLTYNLNGFKSRINRHLSTVGCL